MSQHFLLSSAAWTLSPRDIMRMSDEDAHARFVAIRFAANNGKPFCGELKIYTLSETPIRWKCSGCRRKFSVSSGALFHSRKLPIREYGCALGSRAQPDCGTGAKLDPDGERDARLWIEAVSEFDADGPR